MYLVMAPTPTGDPLKRRTVVSAAASRPSITTEVHARPAVPSPSSTGVPSGLSPATRRRKRRWSRAELARLEEKEQDDSRIYNLMLDVNELRQQIQIATQQLEAHTRVQAAREAFHSRMLAAATQFWRLFRRGYRFHGWTAQEKAFFYRQTHENVTINGSTAGRQTLLEQSQLYTQLFEVSASHIESERVLASDGTNCMIEGCGQLIGRLSRRTLDIVFPGAGEDPALLAQLNDEPFACPLRSVMHLEDGIIVRCDLELDVVVALAGVLPSHLEGVAKLLTRSRLHEPGMLLLSPPEAHTAPVGDLQLDSPSDNRQSIDFILSPPPSQGDPDH